jgi:hypothetical protein
LGVVSTLISFYGCICGWKRFKEAERIMACFSKQFIIAMPLYICEKRTREVPVTRLGWRWGLNKKIMASGKQHARFYALLNVTITSSDDDVVDTLIQFTVG